MEEKVVVKERIRKFWQEHPDFDDRNPEHTREAARLLGELLMIATPDVILKAMEELAEEAS